MSALLYNYNRDMTRSVNEFETYLHNEILRLGTKSTFTFSFFPDSVEGICVISFNKTQRESIREIRSSLGMTTHN